MGLLARLSQLLRRHRNDHSRSKRLDAHLTRLCRFESMEPRQMLSADPLRVGVVYVEEDSGSDLHGDTFYLTFQGGAAGTQLTRIEIDGDQNAPGFGVGDLFFDTVEGGYGADHAFPFTILSMTTRDKNASVTATVVDGSSLLVLDLKGFQAGDTLVFSIDVDEVQQFDPKETNLDIINDGFDPITSGVEFQGSKLRAYFTAPHYHNISGTGEFRNRYDDLLVGTGLDLPEDNFEGKRDRTTGAAFSLVQQPLPVSIAGTVYLETNLDLVRDPGENGIANVTLALWQKQGNQYVFTGHTTKTAADGSYRFGTELDLRPGTYQVRETQPDGLFSVGAIPGTVASVKTGSLLGNDANVLTEITIPLGDQHAVNYDFAEAAPAQISGYVYHDRNDNGVRNTGEEPIAGVAIQVVPVNTVATQSIVTVTTNAQGYYQATGLAPGTYRVVQPNQPTGYFDGRDAAGTVAGVKVGTAVNPGDRIVDIKLGGGQSGINYDFGELAPVSIAGQVCLSDENGSCFVTDVNHPPIAGAVVLLLDSQGNTLKQTTTDNQGRYAFTGLMPGTYQVREVTPAGLIDGPDRVGFVNGQPVGTLSGNDLITGIVLGSGQNGVNYDFCEHPPSSLAGNVYHDANNNGLREVGETPIAGVEIVLLGVNGQVVATTQTGADGRYSFTGLSAGQYSIREVQPQGWLDGRDAAGTIKGVTVGTAQNPGDLLTSITIGWGQQGVDYDFGELLAGTLAGRVHEDLDGDCIFDANEKPIAGVKIDLLDANGNVIRSTVTNAEGRYQFENLVPGTYGVAEHQPQGYFHGGQRVGSHGGDASQRDVIRSIAVGSGQQLTDYDFCEIPPAILMGTVHVDLDGDCLQDPGEPGIGGVKIELLNVQGVVIATTNTLADGTYRFENLEPGVYTVRETQPAGYFQGGQRAGSHGGDSSQADLIRSIPVGPGQHLTQYDFCEVPPGTLAGVVHIDLNSNCIQDPGEAGIGGVRIDLLDSQGNIVATTTTTADGTYRFENLAPGTYSVRETQPDGYFHGGQRAGSGKGDVRVKDLISGIVLYGGEDLVNYDFCEVPPAELSGYVFQDGPVIRTPNGETPANIWTLRDGLFTPDDTPLAGVVMELRDGLSGELILGTEALPGHYPSGAIRVVTDANGHYRFTGLQGGRSYAVYQVQPGGYVDSLDTAGTTGGLAINPNADIDPLIIFQLAEDPRNDAIIRIPLAPAQVSTNNNFSEVLVEAQPPSFPPVNPKVYPPSSLPQPMMPPALGPLMPAAGYNTLVAPAAGGGAGPGLEATLTWHLSIIDAGMPRDLASAAEVDPTLWTVATYLASTHWSAERLSYGRWLLPTGQDPDSPMRQILFGAYDAIPVVGDFNGDGVSEVGVYYHGEWFLDLNGNGRWDEEDLWARLGSATDLPVVGDWDGDGKDDIGIFGPEWAGDDRAIRAEPGLPDAANTPKHKPKNVPPRPSDATDGHRLMALSVRGPRRADVIDHVFRFGADKDRPVAGDWNGDGIRTIGVFKNGVWKLDLDGDGRFTEKDVTHTFGTTGDIPIVGDWNGDGVDQLGVYRRGKWILDSNNNRELDAHDRVFALGGPNDIPVVGDWNGDGIDQPGLYQPVSDLPAPTPAE